jgi:OOP family OmpA-OmpF porin
MNKKISLSVLAVLAFPMPGMSSVHADKAFGEVWRDANVSAPDQVRIVYYRPAPLPGKMPAHIYVDGEFQSALLPKGFTDFCVAPGIHSLGSYVGDAPHYNGKALKPWRDTLEAGKTYYVRANLDNSGRPIVIKPEVALVEMVGLKKQKHVLSRASSVLVCRGGSEQTYENYSFQSDLLFRFNGYEMNDVQGEGNYALTEFVKMLKNRNKMHKNITVTGYTDPLGDEKSNQLLGQRRADTIKKLLVNQGVSSEGITAKSVGEKHVNTPCKGSKTELIQCYANERRVVISVEN